MKTVLHILPSSSFSGAENVVCQIIKMFSGSDYKMYYCSPDGRIRDALEENNIDFLPLREFSVKELKRIISETKPDIIHAHDMRAGFYVSLACGKIPFVSHVHNNNFDSRGLSLKSLLFYHAAKKAKHIFWVSESSFEGYKFHDRFKDKSSVLYNVIDKAALIKKMETDTGEYDFDIAYVGRLTEPKDPIRLMNVFAEIIKMAPDVKIAVAGTGDMAEQTESFAKQLSITDNVKFLGFMSNPYKLLYSSKLMIMTSRWEGTPMCALEAMALGVPIVSTPTDGLCELVNDGKTGFLSSDDAVLAEKCTDIIKNAGLRQTLSENTLKKADELLLIPAYKAALDEVYRQCM